MPQHWIAYSVAMKTIAISIDEETDNALDRLIEKRGAAFKKGSKSRRIRSQLVRTAIREFVARKEQEEREEKDRAAIVKHSKLLARQLKALVSEQAKL
ncbi:MAG TPA: hypothetical protein VKE49_00275 [Myxococcaceae bacterium]|nr:hypothetical protein [Myxococcaceae bacterium]